MSELQTVRVSIVIRDDDGQPIRPGVIVGDSDIIAPINEDRNGWHFDLIPSSLLIDPPEDS